MSYRRVITSFFLALLPLGLLQTKASADNPMEYAIACLWNASEYTQPFSYKWGDDEWQTDSLKPGWHMWLSWDYAYPDQRSSPDLYVKIDANSDGETLIYKLDKYAARKKKKCRKGTQYSMTPQAIVFGIDSDVGLASGKPDTGSSFLEALAEVLEDNNNNQPTSASPQWDGKVNVELPRTRTYFPLPRPLPCPSYRISPQGSCR